MHCTRCGADVEAQYRFCPQCGLRLGDARETAPLAGERKLVTVLFCDLTGSTALAEQLDAEDYSDVLERYIQRAFAEVYRFDGYVNQLAGDGFMAMFGAPVAHEDAPERAVRAALAVQRAIADLAAGQTPIQARIGIHTGPVVVGPVGTDRRMDYTAVGDTTNLAARLEQSAGPGTIVISEATHRLVQGRFLVEETGPLALKGKAEPIMGYRVLGESGVTSAIELAAARGLTPFVGRANELAQIEEAFARARGGHRQIVAVVGTAGSGKSRIVHEFQHRHDGENVTFFEGRCVAIEQATPFHPIVQMFRRHFGIQPGDDLEAALARVRCHQASFHHDTLDPTDVERMLTGFLVDPTRIPADVAADELKRLVFDAVEHGMREHAGTGPMVIVVEDYHFIDEVSQELIEHLARQLADCPVLFLVTHRPRDGMAGHKRGILPVVLDRMPDADIAAMVRAVAGAPPGDDIEQRIVQRAAGSPFFAEELTRGLLEGGALVVRDGRVAPTRPIDDIPIPDTVQEVLAARLDRLAPAVKRVAQVASVFGREVVPRLLLQVLDGEDIDVAGALAELERRGLLHRKGVGEATLRFGESLTQEVAYEGLLLKQRRLLHERIATVLEGAGSGQEMLLAYHYARSENRPKAIEALLAAGAAAERVPAYDVAARLFRQAWDLGEQELTVAPSPATERAVYTAVSALIRFLAMFGIGEVGIGERMAQRARELAMRLGEERAAPTLGYFEAVVVMMQGREHYGRGLEQAEEAFAYAQRVGFLPTMLNVARGLCFTYVVDGRLDVARRTADWIIAEATKLSPAERPSDFQLAVEWLLSVVLYAADDLEGSLRQARTSYERALRFENRTLQCVSGSTLGQIFLLRGRYAEAEEWAELSLTQAERMGNLAAFVPSASVALLSRHMLGRAVDPTPYVDLIERGLRASGPAQVSFRFAAEALLVPGTPAARASELIQHMYKLAGGRLREAIASIGWASVLRTRPGGSAEAERLYHQALAQAETVGVRSVAAEAAVGLAEALDARGDHAGAAREAARAQPTIATLDLGHLARRLERLAPAERVAQAGA